MKNIKGIIFGAAFTIMTQVASAQNKLVIENLNKELQKSGSDTEKVNLLNSLAWEYRNSNLNLTDSFAGEAIQLGNKTDYHKGIGQAYINKALVQRNAGNYATALENCRWAMVHHIKSGNVAGYSSAYNTIASIHFMKGDFSTALMYYFYSLRYSETLKDEPGVARTLNNIGIVYMDQHAYDKALIYYEKAYSILARLKDDAMADCLNNIGGIYQHQKEYDKAIANYEEALRINKMIGDKKDISSSLNNIGDAYYECGDYKKALDNYHQSLLFDEQLGDISSIAISYGNISNCYIKLGMYHAALRYANESLSLAKAFGMKQLVMDAYELLCKIGEEQRDFESALINHKQYKIYSDSIYNDASKERISFLEQQYLKEKEEKQNILATKQGDLNKIIKQEKEKQIQEYIFIIGMILLLFVVLIYVVFFILKRPRISG